MYSRWFSVAVVGLWLTAMGWLVTQKILPPLLVGEPPTYSTILDAQQEDVPIGWEMVLNDRPLGWALSMVQREANGLTEIRSRVHLNELPLEELTPAWLRAMLRVSAKPIAKLEMDTQSTVTVDGLGRLASFESAMRLGPGQKVIELCGTVDENQLRLTVSSGDFSFTPPVTYLPCDSLLADALSPQTQLPGLRVGQTWTMPVYSPLRPPSNPMEVLQARVVSREPMVWDGHAEDTHVVVYYSDPGTRLASAPTERGRLWVRRDGTVLRQRATILDANMTFLRLPDEKAAALASRVKAIDEAQAASLRRQAVGRED